MYRHASAATPEIVGFSDLKPGKYRVVRIIARLNVGGPAQHVIHLSAGLSQQFPTLLIAGDVDAGEAEMLDGVAAGGFDLLRLIELGRRIRPAQDLIALVKLVRILRAVRPDIVHTHTAKAGTLGRIAGLLAGVPVRVHTFHGHVLHGYFSPFMSRLVALTERLLARVTHSVIAVSEAQAHELSEGYHVCARDRIAVVPLGLDLERFARATEADGDSFRREIDAGSSPVITIVGRLVPIKNHDLFVEMAARLAALGRSGVYVVVGGGPEEARLRALVESKGLGDAFRFCGWRRDLARIYAGSDVVVLTSRNEGTPVCLIEALAAARPVVSTAVGGVRDVLQDGYLGTIVDHATPAAMADAVSRLLDDTQLAAEFGRRGANAAPTRFGVPRLLHDVSVLYNDLCARTVPASQGVPLEGFDG